MTGRKPGSMRIHYDRRELYGEETDPRYFYSYSILFWTIADQVC